MTGNKPFPMDVVESESIAASFEACNMLATVLTHWSIRLALLCMVARLAGNLGWSRSTWWFQASRSIWTIGCLCFVLHVVCAFHFYHDWSHARAFESTAAQTYELLGMRFGEGIYFSYAFTLLWLADVVWQWTSPASYQLRAPWLAAGWLGYMSFIAFNGAVIFEGGVTRWVGIPVTMALVAASIILLLRARASAAEKNSSGSLVPGP